MYFSTGKNGVFSVHQFIEEYTQRIGVIIDITRLGVSFEIGMVEIRDVRTVSQHLLNALVDGYGLSDLRDAVLYVDVLDVQHVYGL